MTAVLIAAIAAGATGLVAGVLLGAFLERHDRRLHDDPGRRARRPAGRWFETHPGHDPYPRPPHTRPAAPPGWRGRPGPFDERRAA